MLVTSLGIQPERIEADAAQSRRPTRRRRGAGPRVPATRDALPAATELPPYVMPRAGVNLTRFVLIPSVRGAVNIIAAMPPRKYHQPSPATRPHWRGDHRIFCVPATLRCSDPARGAAADAASLLENGCAGLLARRCANCRLRLCCSMTLLGFRGRAALPSVVVSARVEAAAHPPSLRPAPIDRLSNTSRRHAAWPSGARPKARAAWCWWCLTLTLERWHHWRGHIISATFPGSTTFPTPMRNRLRSTCRVHRPRLPGVGACRSHPPPRRIFGGYTLFRTRPLGRLIPPRCIRRTTPLHCWCFADILAERLSRYRRRSLRDVVRSLI